MIHKLRSAESVKEAVLKATTLGLLARGFGYIKNISIAVIIGFNEGTDAFFFALGVIGIFLIFADVFDSIGVPNLVEALQKSQQYFNRLAATFFTFTFILSCIVTVVAYLALPFVINIAVGFDSKSKQLLEIFYLLLIPYVFTQFYFHHFGAINRSLKRYTVYFFAEFIFSAVNAFVVIIGLLYYKTEIILGVAYIISQAVATVIIVILTKDFIKFDFVYDDKVKEVLKQFFYLTGLYGVLHMFIFIDRAFASLLPMKSVSALSYGLMISTIPRRILKLENILITPLSETNADSKYVYKSVAYIVIYTLPIVLVLFLLSTYIVKLLFGYGAFGNIDVELTSTAVRFYSISLPLMFLWPVLYRIFQIKKDLFPVFIIAIISIIINGISNYLLIVVFNFGLEGICIGTFVAYLCLVFFSFIALKVQYKKWSKSNGESVSVSNL